MPLRVPSNIFVNVERITAAAQDYPPPPLSVNEVDIVVDIRHTAKVQAWWAACIACVV